MDFINEFFKKYISANFKKFMPKGIMGRTLLAMIVPIFLLQAIVIYVFYERHWDIISRRMVNYYVNDIKSAQHLISFENKNQQWIKDFFMKVDGVDVRYFPFTKFEKKDSVYPYLIRRYPQAETAFEREFGANNYNILADEENKKLTTEVSFNGGTLIIKSNLNKLFSSSTLVVILWLLGGGIMVFLIAVPFVKNQSQSIKTLAQIAEEFGKGKNVKDFKPTGAREIRQTGFAFLTMQNRIKKYIENRMKMLSAISHDLRTPLTRIKLEAEFIKDKNLKDSINSDVDEMHDMINSYLEYSKTEQSENNKTVEITGFIEKVVNKYDNFDKEVNFINTLKSPLKIDVKSQSLNRCLNNLIHNSIKYCKSKIEIKLVENKKTITIFVDDDGKGIPESRREDMFKPFTRMDKSRNSKTGGIGLGLAIAKEVVLAHGGSIELLQSSILKGLQVKITIPK